MKVWILNFTSRWLLRHSFLWDFWGFVFWDFYAPVMKWPGAYCHSIIIGFRLLCPPSKKRGILLCTGRSVSMSVGRPDDVHTISWEPFVRLLWYFICWLVMRRGRPLLILRSIGQRSRSFKLEIGIFCLLNILRTFC